MESFLLERLEKLSEDLDRKLSSQDLSEANVNYTLGQWSAIRYVIDLINISFEQKTKIKL